MGVSCARVITVAINFENALKAKQLRKFFNEKGRIYIVVDAISDDVIVPEFLQGDPALRLVLNTRMPQPIYIRDGFVESNFSFSGVAHHCVIPMNRIWAAYVPEQDLTSGLVWDDCVPETVKMVLDAVEDAEPKVEKEKSNMTLIKTPESHEGKNKIKPTSPKKDKKRAFLRVVK